ncbi:MAG: DUF4097 family beta strand repeat-containing protein [Gemmatimonadota bacterium]
MNGIVSRFFSPGALVAAASAIVIQPAWAQQSEQHSLSGRQVAIFNLAGRLTVEGGSGSAVEVELTRGGADGGQLDIATGSLDLGRNIGDVESLRVLYPADDIVYSGGGRHFKTQLRVRDDGSFYHGSGRRRGRRVEIRGSGSGLDAHADLRVRVPSGQRIWLFLGAGEVSVSNVDGRLYVDVGSANVTSRDTQGYLNIDTGSGTVDVSGARGDVFVDTGSGRVRVSDTQGDELNIDTGSGGVIGSDLSVRELVVDTGSGSVELSSLTASEISVDTGSGSVDLNLESSPRSVLVDTGSGSVTLSLPSDFGARVEIETGSGGIRTEFPIQLRRAERDHIIGTIGDGSGRVEIDTGSGSVTIRQS